MKYYKIIDPDLMSGDDEERVVYFGWQKILSPLLEKEDEEEISFLSKLLINLPVLEDNGKLVEKTALMARLVSEDEEIRCMTTYDFPEEGFSLYYEV